MNAKKMKEIRLQAKVLLALWINSLVAEAEQQQIDLRNIKAFLPKDTHIFANGQFRLSAYSYKWAVKGLKKLHRQDPERPISTWRLDELEGIYRPKAY